MPSETPYKRPRIASTAPEFGDCTDVRRVFGFRESFTYHLFKTRPDQKRPDTRHWQEGRHWQRDFSISAAFGQLIAKQQAKQDALSTEAK